MNKQQLRQKYKLKRQQLAKRAPEDLSLAIANKCLELPIWDKRFYHVFLTIEKLHEINTDYLINILNGKDKHILISKTDFKTLGMNTFLLSDNTLIKANKFGIPEPVDGIPIPNSQIEVVFIPLLAFDLQGNRVGYGKGFYDKFLSECPPETIKIGLSFFEAEAEIKNLNKHDIRLNYCVTPEKIYKFTD